MPCRPATERDELIAIASITARVINMRDARTAADRGVRSYPVMLPVRCVTKGSVTTSSPSTSPWLAKDVSGYIGEGTSRWPTAYVAVPAGRNRLQSNRFSSVRCTTLPATRACLSARSPRSPRDTSACPHGHCPPRIPAPCRSDCSTPSCPPQAPSPQNTWAVGPPTPAVLRASTRATTSSGQNPRPVAIRSSTSAKSARRDATERSRREVPRPNNSRLSQDCSADR